MAYREIDTSTWQDPWFEGLSVNSKLLFIYLWTNETCNQAGFYKITKRRIQFDCGVDIDECADEIKQKVEWFPQQGLVWVKNFFKRQCKNSKFAIAGINSAKKTLSSEMLLQFLEYNKCIWYEYGIDTVSLGYSTEQNRTVTEQSSNREGGTISEFRFLRKVPIPKNIYLADYMKAYASQKGIGDARAEDEFEKFCIYHRKVGREFKDWYATWQTWVRNCIEYDKKNQAKEPEKFGVRGGLL
jgi:hypothetical protein